MARDIDKDIAARLIHDLARDFPTVSPIALMGVVGASAMESEGFKDYTEDTPIGGRGGYGMMMWTGQRRKELEAYAAENGLDVAAYETQYQHLKNELEGVGGHDRGVIEKLEGVESADEAMRIFTQTFLRPKAGLEHYDQRAEWTNQLIEDVSDDEAMQDVVMNGYAATAPQPREPLNRGTAESELQRRFGEAELPLNAQGYAPQETRSIRDIVREGGGQINPFSNILMNRDALTQDYNLSPPANADRNDPIQPQLKAAIEAAAFYTDPELEVVINSGGQSTIQEAIDAGAERGPDGKWRTPDGEVLRLKSSTNHDHGAAADFHFKRDGQALAYHDAPEIYDQAGMILASQGVLRQGINANGSRGGFVIHAGGEGPPSLWGYPSGSSADVPNDSTFKAAYNSGVYMSQNGARIQLAPVPQTRPESSGGMQVASLDEGALPVGQPQNPATPPNASGYTPLTPMAPMLPALEAMPPTNAPAGLPTAEEREQAAGATINDISPNLSFDSLQDFVNGEQGAVIPESQPVNPALTTTQPAVATQPMQVAPLDAAEEEESGGGSWNDFAGDLWDSAVETATGAVESIQTQATDAVDNMSFQDKLGLGLQMFGAQIQARLNALDLGGPRTYNFATNEQRDQAARGRISAGMGNFSSNARITNYGTVSGGNAFDRLEKNRIQKAAQEQQNG